MGDGGFAFDQKHDEIPIIPQKKPVKKPRKSGPQPNPTLSKAEKQMNKVTSSHQVVVENTISQLKHWKILSSHFWH
jgi:hypothetical protein